MLTCWRLPDPSLPYADPVALIRQQPFSDAGRTTVDRTGVPVLEVEGLAKSFGGVVAVENVDLQLWREEIVTLVGPNGAGKTTAFDLIAGFVPPDRGRVRLGGLDVTGSSPDELARRGLIRTFQDASLFPTLSVTEVLGLASHRGAFGNLATAMVLPRGRSRSHDAAVSTAIDQFGLSAYSKHRICELSTGTRRVVELAATSLLGAGVVLLDEPSAGIAHKEVEALALLLRRLRHTGVTLLVIDHDMTLCRQISDRMIVMREGAVMAEGPPTQVLHDPAVIEAYLGSTARTSRCLPRP